MFSYRQPRTGPNPLQSVSDTNIFARSSTEGRQYLVYSMTLKADAELAMILPLPVPEKTGERDVNFIDLKEYKDFFVEMDHGFPHMAVRGFAGGGRSDHPASPPKLKVVEVGSFEASFVPTIADFDRLDERFRLPKETWHHLPQYKKFGFAVFKLKPGEKRIHPMAFEFPRSDSKRLFFPTVHVHDGEVHATADFDHTLYCQQNPDEHFRALHEWGESSSPASRFMRIPATKGIVAADSHCYMRRMAGKLKNEDNYVYRNSS
jgi:hypothetical protein